MMMIFEKNVYTGTSTNPNHPNIKIVQHYFFYTSSNTIRHYLKCHHYTISSKYIQTCVCAYHVVKIRNGPLLTAAAKSHISSQLKEEELVHCSLLAVTVTLLL